MYTHLAVQGELQAVKPNPAVSIEILSQISQLEKSGLAMSDIIQRIRLQMVPPGYVPQT